MQDQFGHSELEVHQDSQAGVLEVIRKFKVQGCVGIMRGNHLSRKTWESIDTHKGVRLYGKW